jgi:hypothetical protein
LDFAFRRVAGTDNDLVAGPLLANVPPIWPEPITAIFVPHHNGADGLADSKPAGVVSRAPACAVACAIVFTTCSESRLTPWTMLDDGAY